MLEQRLQQIASTAPNDEAKNKFLKEMAGFKDLFNFALFNAKNAPVDWNKIKPPPEGMVIDFKDLAKCPPAEVNELLDKLVVLKLNGGLGTSMGCQGPKSAIEVHSGYTFLDLTVRQIEYLNETYNSNVPLVLMNSFNTEKETLKILHKYDQHSVTIYNFNQNRYPRIDKETLLPVAEDVVGDVADWYPPGHGDVFHAFKNSDIFQTLKEQGKTVVFISNIDNLGATVDFQLLRHMVRNDTEYIMEVTNKSRADIKGGTLIDYEGKAKLLEIAQVPSNKLDEFKSVKKFKIFNTNNLWVDLNAIERLVSEDAFREMDVIHNIKSMEKNGSKIQVIQFERAAGAAIQYFQNGIGVNVPRSRFLPVKSTSDLFVVQSNLYSLEEGALTMNPLRPFPSVPLVKLGAEFTTVQDYNSRFQSIPDILELYHLTVSGNVYFGSNVTLGGTVIIVANHGSRIDIPSGSILENKVISGNLRILDH